MHQSGPGQGGLPSQPCPGLDSVTGEVSLRGGDRRLPGFMPVQGPGPGSGKDRGEKLPVQADLPLTEMLPALAGCV